MNNIVVYTAITNGYDGLKEPKVIPDNCDFICFTDDLKIQSDVWKIVPIPKSNYDAIRKCRQIKTQPHKFVGTYKYSVWIDGNIDVIGDVNELVSTHLIKGKKGMAVFAHPFRSCAYEEAKACIAEGKDRVQIIQNQMEEYKEIGYPLDNGLVESNVLLREHNLEKVVDLMDDWWKEIKEKSRRDQLSFNYVAWKHDFNYDLMKGNTRGRSDYFAINDHKKGFLYYLEKLHIKMETFIKSLK